MSGIDDVSGKYGPKKVQEIIDNAYDPKKKRTHAGDGLATAEALTEERLAQEFENQYQGELRYDHDRKCWYVWNEQHGYWQQNRHRIAFHFAREVCRKRNVQEAKEFARAKTYGAIEQIAQASPMFAVSADFWDRDPWLLGTPAGTVDLRTREIRAPYKTDYITKQTSVAPNFEASAPVFEQFLNEITQQDKELQRYLQRIAGYSLTGSIREEKLFFIYGPGGNGKSKFVYCLQQVAGDYAVTAAMEAFIEHKGERHTTDIAALAGARLVTASETHKGRHWDEALIGKLTGGDKITARFMRRDNFTYLPQFTLLIVGNYAPELYSVNAASRRRFVIIPFTFQPTERDEKLIDKLCPEYPAILAWAIKGAGDWYQYGLGEMPNVVREETNTYFEAQDIVRAWVDECCELGTTHQSTSEHLFASYQRWCKRTGEFPGTQNELIRILKNQHNCKSARIGWKRGLKGIALRTASTEKDDE